MRAAWEEVVGISRRFPGFSPAPAMRVVFGEWIFDSDARLLSRGGEPAPLTPKAFDLLDLLIRERPRAVAKAEIHERLWPGTFVSESNLPNLIVELRAALGDSARPGRIIRTAARFGYSFGADARARDGSIPDPIAPGPAYRLIWGKREIALDPGENLIGRDRDSVVWIDDESVSRRHARVVIDSEGATLEDLGSKNGTYVGEEKLRTPRPLADRDQMTIGPARMVLRIVRRTGSTVSKSGERAPR
jgi:DNA-binding winged helix-turn-helix (wHTH) protein